MSYSIGVGGFRAVPETLELINETLKEGRLSYGPLCREFESRFAELHGCTYAILSNSGTSALHVALQALKELRGWEDGDEVIVPATTFVATSNIVLHNRMRPVFVDVEPGTLNISPDLCEQAIGPLTRAIIPVHLCGLPANMAELASIASWHGLEIVEDSCETMFAKHADRSVGAWGSVGCFSTYVAHVITTGVGGICTTSDPELAAKIRSLTNHGLSFEYLNPDAGYQPRPMGNRRFEFDAIGHSFRITELEAAIGLPQLRELAIDENLRIRRRNAQHLTAGLRIINRWAGDVFELAHAEQPGHTFMIYPVILRRGSKFEGRKEELMTRLGEAGIETRDLMPLLGQPAEPYRSLRRDEFPVSEWIRSAGFYVGCHPYLEPEDVQRIVDTIGEYIGEK